MKPIIILLLFMLTLKLVSSPDPSGRFDAYWDIDFIIIYSYNSLSQAEYNFILGHELQHQLCWQLFGIYPKNIYEHNPRCFK